MLWAVRYLHHMDRPGALPALIVECNHPPWCNGELPSVEDVETGERWVGFSACMEYLERVCGIRDIATASVEFSRDFPDYRVRR